VDGLGAQLRSQRDPNRQAFFGAGSAISGEAEENVQRLFADGMRNSFGMAFDPHSGDLWDQQNADDAASGCGRDHRHAGVDRGLWT
jgi:aldose sugar dehydrogenase